MTEPMKTLEPIDGADHASSLVRFLYPTPAERSVVGIFRWWERRRLGYNLIVGSAGVVSLGLSWLISALPPDGQIIPMFPDVLVPIGVVGLLANLWYFAGSITESVVHRIWGRNLLPVGPALFRMGLTFSVGVMFIPTLMMIMFWVARVLGLVPT